MHLPLFDLSAAKIEVHHCSSVESLYNLIILKKHVLTIRDDF
jgi:hypothetical protein